MQASPLKRREIIDALRIGEVPRRGLELFAVGLGQFEKAIDDELASTATGQGRLKAVRGEYGTGKTFFSRWLEHRAREQGFATTLVQISETETPLYKMETVYRRAVSALQTSEWSEGAFRSLIDRWFFNLEEEILGSGVNQDDGEGVAKAVGDLLEQRLAKVSATQPQFAAALRRAHTARVRGEHAIGDALIGWLMGLPNVGAAAKRAADIKGELDNDGAAGFFRGLLEILRQTGRKGLVLVLDEVETIQRVRADSREKSLNALRHFIGELSHGHYPGLYVLITGTPAFFDGSQGIKRAPALAQRLHTEFDPNGYDNPKAPQIRLKPFDVHRMIEVGERIRDIYPADSEERLNEKVTREVIDNLAHGVSGKLGGKVGIAPRIFLKKLVDLCDKVDHYPDYDPKLHSEVVLNGADLTDEEREASGISRSVDDIALDLEGHDNKGSLE